MSAGTSGFSLGRAINRRRYFYALIAADPSQAVTHAVDYWVSKGAWGETNGMRDQLAQHGWVGAEIIIGSDLRGLAIRPLLDAIPGVNLVPSATPTPLKRTSQERTEILVAARSCSVGDAQRPNSGAARLASCTMTAGAQTRSWTCPSVNSLAPSSTKGSSWKPHDSSTAATCRKTTSSPWTASSQCGAPPKRNTAGAPFDSRDAEARVRIDARTTIDRTKESRRGH